MHSSHSTRPRLHLTVRRLAPLALAIPLLLTAGGAAAQAIGRSEAVEARLRALEARVSALEGRAGAAAPAASAPVDCKVFDLRSNPADQSRLSITANGRAIGSYKGRAAPYLTTLLRRGVNDVVFAYDSPGDGNTLLQVYCIPPDAEERVEILRFTPEAGKLEERVSVNMVAPGR